MPTRVGRPRRVAHAPDLYVENEYRSESPRSGVALCRLPTGMSNLDVEREMAFAVREIASSDDESFESDRELEGRQYVPERREYVTGSEGFGMAAGEGREYVAKGWVEKRPVMQGEGELAAITQTPPDQISASPTTPSPSSSPGGESHKATRAQSDAATALLSPWQRNAVLDSVKFSFSRRTASTHSTTSMRWGRLDEDEFSPRSAFVTDGKGRFATSKDAGLFEDDYLSFQGYHHDDSRSSHYQSMSGLLRSKRISSVTDSHSEGSDEITIRDRNSACPAQLDVRRRSSRRGKLPSVLRFNRRSTSDVCERV